MERQRAIVAVPWGPLRGRRAVIEPGAALRVGRAEWADLKVPHDRLMSGVHFEITWDGASCRVRDLESVTGTLIDGEAGRTEGEIGNGGWIKAGETVFTVHVEGATPPPESETATLDDDNAPGHVAAARRREAAVRRARVDSAATALVALEAEAANATLFAVMDAARDPRVLELLHESVDAHQSLYEGAPGEAMAEYAPYLVELPRGSRLLGALVREGWGKRWGIFIASDLPFKEVRRHLRRFLMVHDVESAERMYFRFYDPRVLAAFLGCATPRQTAEIFGDLQGLLVEAADRSVRRFSRPAPQGEV